LGDHRLELLEVGAFGGHISGDDDLVLGRDGSGRCRRG
jgi:hypothetical protein